MQCHIGDLPDFDLPTPRGCVREGANSAKRTGQCWRCGAGASSFVAAFIDGKTNACDALDRDPYGQITLRCEASSADLGATLIENRLASAFSVIKRTLCAA